MLFGLELEQFDILGLVVFIFISLVAFWGIFGKNSIPKWVYILLLLVGIGGSIIDGAIVYEYFIS